MKKYELRIGNFVNTFINTTEGKLYTRGIIQALHINTVEVEKSYTCQYNMIEPIGLNNEWLEKFGFEKYSECFYKIKINGEYSDGWYLNGDNEIRKSMSEFFVRIKYVHQLQNLYFILTGKELIIK